MSQSLPSNERSGPSPAGVGRLRVAVVDDHAPTRALVRATLDGSGIASVVAEAAGSPEQVEAACAQEPDVILLDQQLGDVRGTELLGDVLRSCPTAMVAIYSALDPADEEAEALRAGAFTYYEKHLVAEVLPEVISEDYALFQRALAGEDVCTRSAMDRRLSMSGPARTSPA